MCNKRTKEILFHACLVTNVTYVTGFVVLIKTKHDFKNIGLAHPLNCLLTHADLQQNVGRILKASPVLRDAGHAWLGRFLTHDSPHHIQG